MARGRMIDKVIILSTKINAISEGAENLYYRIYVNTDDFGLFHADPTILKGQVYTLRNISVPTVRKRLTELIEIGLVKIYEIDGEKYLKIVGFEKHQTFRKDYVRKYKYPKPVTNSYELVRTRTESPTNINKTKLNQIKTSCSEKHSELATLLEEKIKERLPKHKFAGKDYLKEWSNEFRIMEEKEEAVLEEIKELIIWVFKDDFWYKNILSAEKLRKQYGRLCADMNDDKKKRGVQTSEDFDEMQERAMEKKK